MTDLSTAVNAPGVTDMAYDGATGILYLTTLSGEVLRWNAASGSFLEPIYLGGDLTSIAVSPDGASLVVGTAGQVLGKNGHQLGEVDRITVSTSAVTRLSVDFTALKTATSDESGIASVAVANNGEALFTTLGYSGWNPLREFPASGSAIGNATVGGVPFPGLYVDSSIASSSDGKYAVILEGGISNSPLLVYSSSSNSIVASGATGVFSSGALDINDKTSLILSGHVVLDFQLHQVEDLYASFGLYNATGGAFSLDGKQLFVVDGGLNEVRIFNTTSWTEVRDIQLPTGADPSAWNASLSADGRFLFLQTKTGFDSIDLNAGDAAAPSAAPASPPSQDWTAVYAPGSAWPSNTVTTTSTTRTVAQEQHSGGFILTDPSSPAPSLTIAGSVNVSSSTPNVTGAAVSSDYSGDFNNSLVRVNASGQLVVNETGAGSSAYGFNALNVSPKVENDGLWSVSAALVAYGAKGIESLSGAASDFLNKGTFSVSAAYAYGVTSYYGLTFANSGHVSVSGSTLAIGVQTGGGSFTNSGTFQVSGPHGGSVGILLTGSYGTAGLPITNSGTLSADIAIAVQNGGSPASTSIVNLNNSGTINGAIDLGQGHPTELDTSGAPGSQITNTGRINGAVHFDNGNVLYSGAQGTQTGGIYLGAGTARVILGKDGETVYGGSGAADIIGGAGNDTVQGGTGATTFSYESAKSGVTVSLANAGPQNTHGAGTDTLVNVSDLVGSAFNDTLTASGPNQTLEGGAGADTLVAGLGPEALDGGAGTDTAVYAGSSSDYAIDQNGGMTTVTGDGQADTLTNVEVLQFSNEQVAASGAATTLVARAVGDTLVGGAGADKLTGEAGDDVLIGNGGADALNGGGGTNTAVFHGAFSAYKVTQSNGATQVKGPDGTDTLNKIQILQFDDRQVVNGSAATTVHARAGGDVLVGGAGGDTLLGSAGNDTLIGGAGKDTLTGGGGADHFVFTAIGDSKVATPDLITDWVSGDLIDLSAIDADTKTAGNQAFHFGASAGHTGDIVSHYDAAHNRTVVDLYIDKDAKADAEIWLSGNHALGTGDFVL